MFSLSPYRPATGKRTSGSRKGQFWVMYCSVLSIYVNDVEGVFVDGPILRLLYADDRQVYVTTPQELLIFSEFLESMCASEKYLKILMKFDKKFWKNLNDFTNSKDFSEAHIDSKNSEKMHGILRYKVEF